jgi:putative phosphoribosyl transferase
MSREAHPQPISQALRIPAWEVFLDGDLVVPAEASGLVIFAHGSGSGRHSPRNRAVAASLQKSGLGTLLLDLLSRQEELIDDQTGALRFDIPLLAERLVGVTDSLAKDARVRELPLGYFGASTGGAAALVAAAARPRLLRAVVSRGGRPDLAGAALDHVRAPILLIVGGEDRRVLELNRAALEGIRAEKSLKVIPGATHLFSEPGALEEVARLAGEWFRTHFDAQPARRRQTEGSSEASASGARERKGNQRGLLGF